VHPGGEPGDDDRRDPARGAVDQDASARRLAADLDRRIGNETSSAWLPSASSRRSGVLPRAAPSIVTAAPAGVDSTDSVAGTDAAADVLRIDST
jgi:hypothetical protein